MSFRRRRPSSNLETVDRPRRSEDERTGGALPADLEVLPFGKMWGALPDLAARGGADPASLRDRMAMYRMLVERTGERELLGPAGERHVFWGYASQLFWQSASGRLGLGTDGDRIDPGAWWGSMNATLSVLPMRAAVRAGAVPPIAIGQSAVDDPAFEPAVQAWVRFFRSLDEAGPGADLERLRFLSWRAHLGSIEVGVRRYEGQLRLLPAAEQRFARGWTRMVDFLGAAAAPTDLPALRRWGAGALPMRVLRDDEPASGPEDMDAEVRRALRAITALGVRPRWRFAIDRRVWQRAMRARDLRADAGDILFGPLGREPATQRRVLRAALAPY